MNLQFTCYTIISTNRLNRFNFLTLEDILFLFPHPFRSIPLDFEFDVVKLYRHIDLLEKILCGIATCAKQDDNLTN